MVVDCLGTTCGVSHSGPSLKLLGGENEYHVQNDWLSIDTQLSQGLNGGNDGNAKKWLALEPECRGGTPGSIILLYDTTALSL